MSDEPDRPRVITAPLGVTPAEPPAEPPATVPAEPPAAVPETTVPMTAKPGTVPMNHRAATQMSQSAVPSTLDSPQAPALSPPGTTAEGAVVIAASPNAVGSANDEINGAAIARRDAARDEAAPAHPVGGGTAEDAILRVGPATMMSPAVLAPLPGEPAAPLAPENAVIDVGAPTHAFVPYGSGAPPGFGGPHAVMHHGSAGPGGSGVAPGRSTSTTFLVLVVGGAVAAVAVLAIVVIGIVLISRRRAAEDDGRDPRPSGTVAPGSPEAPRGPPRMGGTKARIAVTSAGALDPEAVRLAITGVLPRIDACFAATELDAPNHESASYDLDVAPNGEVRRAEPATPVGRSLKLDACMVQNLRSIRMPRSTRSSAVKLTFSAPIEPR